MRIEILWRSRSRSFCVPTPQPCFAQCYLCMYVRSQIRIVNELLALQNLRHGFSSLQGLGFFFLPSCSYQVCVPPSRRVPGTISRGNAWSCISSPPVRTNVVMLSIGKLCTFKQQNNIQILCVLTTTNSSECIEVQRSIFGGLFFARKYHKVELCS
jgi:hypothetical protein